ncbi:MAG: hypothetical protein HY671_01380 [Chloroflexi bacterium]|nr:hypothetical protein [Chloroflexota bacterium]
MLRLGWFSTGRDEAARQLLQVVHRAIAQGRLAAEISFVFCSRAPGESRESDLFIQMVRDYGFHLVHLSFKEFAAASTARASRARLRSAYDRQVVKLLEGFNVDLCVLAGYMLVVSPEMCRRYPMINLHPAAPGGPKGTWQEVIWQLIESRATSSGVVMHLVTPKLDEGPPVTYCTYSLRGPAFDPLWTAIERMPFEDVKQREGEGNPLFRLIREEGLKREFPLILATLSAFSEGQVKLMSGMILNRDGDFKSGKDLTPEVEAALEAVAG